ncbi:hypothetical protein Cob_v001098 [Colletotrichum orbiculare MAFF 240422]|uniref:Uncharacterized protein n=1 Tax=Colletotrichum orbiculare (strain 104-T / ATCC 96160 / CBS 514.97 / LARS 414 / MAFF 240422) TaxID=1213857 RepID=A0A484G569_COLOR|nr:hypothetical protein Cob_v001098 [Colletotrichum orbiculare MAFF 240422]
MQLCKSRIRLRQAQESHHCCPIGTYFPKPHTCILLAFVVIFARDLSCSQTSAALGWNHQKSWGSSLPLHRTGRTAAD